MYWRSMTVAERNAYAAKVREWIPNLGIKFLFDDEYPGLEPGAPDAFDNTIWTFARNGLVIQNYAFTYIMVNYEGDPGTYAFTPEQYRESVRDLIFQDPNLFAPIPSDTPPDGLNGGPGSLGSASQPVAMRAASGPVTASRASPLVRVPSARSGPTKPPPGPPPSSIGAAVTAAMRAAPPGSHAHFAVSFPPLGKL